MALQIPVAGFFDASDSKLNRELSIFWECGTYSKIFMVLSDFSRKVDTNMSDQPTADVIHDSMYARITFRCYLFWLYNG